MAKLDVTTTNDAIDRLLEVTENPRHRYLLMAYHRHRFLEIAGRYEEIFVPEMTIDEPVYHFKALGITAKLTGAAEVKGLYHMWAETNQSIFWSDDEEVAVANSYVATVATGSQQVLGSALIGYGIDVDDPDAMYIYRAREEMIWTYDERGRLTGEDVWEPDSDKAEIIKLDPDDVLTTKEAARLLEPLIKPLPSFDDMVLGAQTATA